VGYGLLSALSGSPLVRLCASGHVPIPDVGRLSPGYFRTVGNGRSGQVAEVNISPIWDWRMSEAVAVDSERRLNRDIAPPNHRDRIFDGMAMARITGN
jgi:hypothetical protein